MLTRMLTTCHWIPALVVLSGFVSAATAQAPSSPQNSKNASVEIVLLKNGRVLSGTIIRTADQVHVQTPNGSRIVLTANRVDAIFDSMEDVFQRRQSKLSDEDAEQHRSLFYWCLQHRMKNAAQQQLDHLMLTNLDVRKLKAMDHQFTIAFERPIVANQQQPKTKATQSHLDLAFQFRPLPPTESMSTRPTDAIVDRAFALASHTEPAPATESHAVEPEESNLPAKSARNTMAPSVGSELDSMADRLQRADLHQFQRRIQPVLLKGCLAAKCHHSEAAVMPLMHRGHGRLVPKRFTQRNLQSILMWIDAEDPDSSQLLTRSNTAHANQETAAIDAGSSEFERLAAWVKSIAENSPELCGASPATSHDLVSKTSSPSTARSESSSGTSGVPANPKADPFDPTEFNRHHE